ncbi:(d)CMP kinase [Anaeroselena agilis]|uniref:Cytidylate kinase n=1 Tax=Anaeroselena agilis TaxID=3063788 RepID=A0ABU3NY43_9FIRM|nr:(d)CMP kinase [Selenomonadales bacterium 4137-cl]
MKKLIIAIDGPAGAGKSTVARLVAERLGYTYIDTGAMYRAVTWDTMRRGIPAENAEKVAAVARAINLHLATVAGKTLVKVDDTDITDAIRTPEVSRQVAEISKNGGVREAMVHLQRQMAGLGGVVMDGRDIGTHVLPGADIKIFLTASIAERALRRWRELTDKGLAVDLAELRAEIACRDKADCEREIAPLVQAADAALVDTTDLTIPQAVEKILELCEARTSVL